MLEVMIPDIYWDNEYWCIKNLKSITELEDLLKCADGSVNNLIIDLKADNNITEVVNVLFKEFSWIDKIIIKEKTQLLGIYKRSQAH